MKVLITGADGFIGSHLTEALYEEVIRSELFVSIIHLIIGVG